MGIGSDLASEASNVPARKGIIERWLITHPEEAVEFWAFVEGVLKSGGNLYPTMNKLTSILGGPPGVEMTVRRYIRDQLEKLGG